MSRKARRERLVERMIRVETVGMMWYCVGRRVNNPRCSLGGGRWFAMDGSDSRLTTARAAWSPRSSSIHPSKRYLGTEVPKYPNLLPHQFRQPAPAASACSSVSLWPSLARPTNQMAIATASSSSPTGVRASLPTQGPLPGVWKQVHGRQKRRKLSQLRHLVAAVTFS